MCFDICCSILDSENYHKNYQLLLKWVLDIIKKIGERSKVIKIVDILLKRYFY
jgi:hypothetical protein